MTNIYLNNGTVRFITFLFYTGTYVVKYDCSKEIVNEDDIKKRTAELVTHPDYVIDYPEDTIKEVFSEFNVDFEIVSTDSVNVEDIVENSGYYTEDY